VDELLADENFGGRDDPGTNDYDLFWAATDHMGSVRQLIDENENIVEHREYDSFGQITQLYDDSGMLDEVNDKPDLDALDSVFAFAGREWDNDAGLYYNRARWLDPRIGRFLSEDPLGFEGGDSNLYRYANNDPFNLVDPSGHSWLSSFFKKVEKGVKNTFKTIENIVTNFDDVAKGLAKDPLFWVSTAAWFVGIPLPGANITWGAFKYGGGLGGFSFNTDWLKIGTETFSFLSGQGFNLGAPTLNWSTTIASGSWSPFAPAVQYASMSQGSPTASRGDAGVSSTDGSGIVLAQYSEEVGGTMGRNYASDETWVPELVWNPNTGVMDLVMRPPLYSTSAIELANQFEAAHGPISAAMRSDLLSTYQSGFDYGTPIEFPASVQRFIASRIAALNADAKLERITKAEFDASRYAELRIKPWISDEERRFLDNYEIQQIANDPGAKLALAMNVMTALAGAPATPLMNWSPSSGVYRVGQGSNVNGSRVTLYHYGSLPNGASNSRYLSTSPSSSLSHYHSNGQLYKFEVPSSVMHYWVENNMVQTLTDVHQPTNIKTNEVRIYPPASGDMNNYLVP
jgi:RHS repeat-associated protein